MRKFARSHWKIIIAILLAIALATLTLETDSAAPAPDLSARLRNHVGAIAAQEHDSAQAARHIQTTLQGYGYRLRRQEYQAGGQKVRNIEVSVSNTVGSTRPERIFIVGAHYDPAHGAPGADDKVGGTAAVLELARLLKSMQPSRGTEVRFVFLVNENPPSQLLDTADNVMEGSRHSREAGKHRDDYPATGNFIAFVGTLESSALVRQALAAFKAQSDLPAQGLAAPAHVMGVTLSDHSSYKRQGYPALMITDTAFMRYPYYQTLDDTPDKLDYASMARVVKGLARTIESLAGAART